MMSNYEDLQSCCVIQPRRKHPPASKTAKNLAEELMILLDYDQSKAKAILKQLVIQNPKKSVEWYYETAVNNLTKMRLNAR